MFSEGIEPPVVTVPHRALNPDHKLHNLMICAAVEQYLTWTTKDFAREFGISRVRVSKILKSNGYRSFKLHRANEMFLNDQYFSVKFCERVIEMVKADKNVATIILFTDEWSFPIPGRHNPLVGIGLGKITQKLNSGILGGQYCGAVFYLWRPQFPKVFATAAEQHDSCSSCFGPFYSIWLQQDGYPAHSSILVREYLSKLIPGRLIAGFCNIDGHIP